MPPPPPPARHGATPQAPHALPNEAPESTAPRSTLPASQPPPPPGEIADVDGVDRSTGRRQSQIRAALERLERVDWAAVQHLRSRVSASLTLVSEDTVLDETRHRTAVARLTTQAIDDWTRGPHRARRGPRLARRPGGAARGGARLDVRCRAAATAPRPAGDREHRDRGPRRSHPRVQRRLARDRASRRRQRCRPDHRDPALARTSSTGSSSSPWSGRGCVSPCPTAPAWRPRRGCRTGPRSPSASTRTSTPISRR
uniref:Uncharacterized protein n=1 Tax=Janibacter limosus TaxID=53458 RepID=A0AC61U1Q7_9MICO|nr:hypothetical protein [Janibacter limosus]